MGRKGNSSRGEPVRFVVERVYTGKESMEEVLTAAAVEAAKQNLEKMMDGQKKAG